MREWFIKNKVIMIRRKNMACNNPKCKNPDCTCGDNCSCDENHQCSEKNDNKKQGCCCSKSKN